MGMKLGLSHYVTDINSIQKYGTAEDIWAQGGRVKTPKKKMHEELHESGRIKVPHTDGPCGILE